MSRRSIVNLILIAAVIGLTIYIKKNPVKNSEPVNFASISKDIVDTIVIQRRDKQELILEKVEGGWVMTSPVSGNVLPEKINLLLKFLDLRSRHQQEITKEKQLARYNLELPKISMFLNDQQFDFGGVNDFNKLRYILHENTIHSVKDITYHLLVMDASSFLHQTESR